MKKAQKDQDIKYRKISEIKNMYEQKNTNEGIIDNSQPQKGIFRSVNCPSFFQEFLGKTPRIIDIITILTVTLGIVTFLGIEFYDELVDDAVWKYILYLFISFDIIAGSIANFTKSTQCNYQDNEKNRIGFLILHIIHVTLIYLSAGHLWYCVGILCYTLFGAFVVNFTKDTKQGEILSSVFISVGCIIFYAGFNTPKIILWVPALLMNKLIMGFGVRREKKQVQINNQSDQN